MIALPVLAVSAADVLLNTQNVSAAESIPRRLGTAQALVTVDTEPGLVVQGPDPEQISFPSGPLPGEPLDAESLSEVLGGARLLEYDAGDVRVESDQGAVSLGAFEVDAADPLAEGLFDLRSGRFAQSSEEVVVNETLLEEGYAVGERLRPTSEKSGPLIVGVAESTTLRSFPVAVGLPGGLISAPSGGSTWLVGGDPVPWDVVRRVNDAGASVLSRAVLLDPPSADELDPDVAFAAEGVGPQTLAVVGLVVAMALLEVVLLAGPAFAVGARRQAHSLALVAAAGGNPAQARRTVLAGGVVLGLLAAILGVVAGVGLASVLRPVLQARVSTYFGPFEAPPLQLLGIGLFGLLSALLAAVVPAWLVSRQDVVATLAGRRGDRSPSRRSPILGAGLLGVGVAAATYGATASSDTGALLITGAAVASVLGMILLVPLALTALAAGSRGLPLALRYAVRDAARQRARTVPAVAAVAATVAGVVALGIAISSDEAQNRETYQASLPAGTGVVESYDAAATWDAARAVLAKELPEASLTELKGVPEFSEDPYLADVRLRAPGQGRLLDSYGSLGGTSVLVGDGPIPPVILGLSDDERHAAETALSSGRVVAFASREVEGDSLRVVATIYDGRTGESVGEPKRVISPGVVVSVGEDYAGPQVVLPEAVASELGLTVQGVGLAVTGIEIDPDQEARVTEALAGVSESLYFDAENGYQSEQATVIIQLVLGGLGVVLMLGGTLTATFLALADARPDLATLAAVGAAPRTRRGVAASYALVVGVVGAGFGAVVGFVPGLAITYPLTYQSGDTVTGGSGYVESTGIATGPFIDVPWLLILGLVVALPLLTAAVMWLTARSRLPLVARLD